MAIYIGKNKKIKNIFVNVNGEKKSISSAWVNKEGVATKVFQLENNENDPYEVAPANEYSDWNYTLDEDNNTITLNYYKSSKTDVIVYANYVIDGKTYKTQLYNQPLNIVSSKRIFRGSKLIKSIKFSDNIDTSNIANFSYMFEGCSALENIDFGSNFDTHNAINMTSMFDGCDHLSNLDLTNFDTHNVTNMASMFSYCYLLKNIYVSADCWIINSDCNIVNMFKYCGTSSVTYK